MKRDTLLYSIPELSDLFGMKRSTLYYWVHIGQLEAPISPPEPLLFELAAVEMARREVKTAQPLVFFPQTAARIGASEGEWEVDQCASGAR